MNTDWQDYLINAGATFEQDLAVHFGNPQRERKVTTTGSVISPLTQYAIMTVDGEDASSFLQGQLTNDVTLVDTHHSQLSGYCNPQGRLLALCRLFMYRNCFTLTLSPTLADDIIKRLKMFVLMSKVTIENSSENIVGIGFSGPNSSQQLAALFESIPDSVNASVDHGSLILIRTHGILPRYEIYGPVEEIRRLWEKLDVHAAPVGFNAWQYLDILAGQPQLTTALSAQFIPQMLNLQALNGVSFKKGCYTGQEIIARLHYRGKLKRRLYRLHIDGDTAPAVGDSLYTESGQAAGTVISAQPAPDGGFAALAVLIIEHAEQGPIRLHGADGPRLQLLDLPYAVDDKADKAT